MLLARRARARLGFTFVVAQMADITFHTIHKDLPGKRSVKLRARLEIPEEEIRTSACKVCYRHRSYGFSCSTHTRGSPSAASHSCSSSYRPPAPRAHAAYRSTEQSQVRPSTVFAAGAQSVPADQRTRQSASTSLVASRDSSMNAVMMRDSEQRARRLSEKEWTCLCPLGLPLISGRSSSVTRERRSLSDHPFKKLYLT